MRRLGSGGARGTVEVPRITTAREPLADDVARRTRRYLVQMSVRIVCFVGAALVDSWIRWLMVVAAVLLPYVAVVLANAGRGQGETPGTFFEPRVLEPRRTDDERRP